MLRVEALEVRIAGRVLVHGLDLEVRPGERWGMLGRNGAGKSTLLHVLAGLRAADSGRVLLHDEPIATIARRRVACTLGVLLQEESREYWGSARDYAMLGRYPHMRSLFGPGEDDRARVDAALAAMDLVSISGRAYRSLSGGERQRARLAALFAQEPSLYLCDEPLQHLDLPHQVAVLEWIRGESVSRQAASMLVLHDLIFASRHCDHLLLLFADGTHVIGTRDEILTPDNLRVLYGFPVEVREVGGERLFLPARGAGDARV